jgi:hypothetical protein
MRERSPIPADLRRQILLEAGHRCAIHTCRHVDVDVHHIVPWAKVQEHTFENLIALCPNCHRRAEWGDIDRKSLRLYKARLAAAFRFQDVGLYPEEVVLPTAFGWLDPAGGWRTEALTASVGSLDVTIEYPRFSEDLLGDNATAVNGIVRRHVDSSVAAFESLKDEPPDGAGLGYYLQGSFSVSLLRASMVSVRFAFESYTGGAHGAHWTEAANVHTNPIRELGIADIFEDAIVGLNRLSEYVVRELLGSAGGYTRDEASVRTGAGPDPKNFRSFNLTSRGLLVRFDEYQVGSYAEGPSEVHVPYKAFADVIDRGLAAELYWHDA